jgi:medium-chain acyl-[acyl-carrier-protein] hydrolase
MMVRTEMNDTPLLAGHKPNPRARLRLFCFPYSGGAARAYRDWQTLPPEIDVCAIELPGRGNRLREAPLNKMSPAVEVVGKEIISLLDRPYAFFGHSMGAIMGFEVARLLRRCGKRGPTHLFVSGHKAPQIPKPERCTYNLPDAELIEELQRLNGTPREVLEHPDIMQLMLPLLRADFECIQTYSYKHEPPLDCPITVFGGLSDPFISRETLEQWREQTTAGFSLRMFPGDHFFLNKEQADLLRVLAQEAYKTMPLSHGL